MLGGEPFDIGTRAGPYRVRLYVAGNDKKSRQAIASLKKLSSLFVPGRFSAEVIDLYQNFELARRDNVLAVPAMVKIHPPPPSTFIGATNDHAVILRKLGIPVDPALLRAPARLET